MDGLHPGVLGWPEFWLRVGLLTFAFLFVVLLVATVVKLASRMLSGLRWATRRVRRR